MLFFLAVAVVFHFSSDWARCLNSNWQTHRIINIRIHKIKGWWFSFVLSLSSALLVRIAVLLRASYTEQKYKERQKDIMKALSDSLGLG